MVVSVLAIVQARMQSIRLPGKVLKKIKTKSLIEILFYRLSQSKKIDKIILATSENKENDILSKTVEKLGFEVFRGSEEDVLDRYFQAASHYNPKTVVRITGDCPIVDPRLVDQVIELYQGNDVSYASNTSPPTYPDGLDTEVFSFTALKSVHEQATEPYEREHVTPFILTNRQFKRMNYSNETDHSNERWTIDNPEDLTVIESIVNHFSPNLDFTWKDVLVLKKTHPEYFEPNLGVKRNEGFVLGTGQKLWKRAKHVIPGGNMLLSKRAEMFLPDQWPAYFSRAKGCKVWDLDEREYIDMSIMGIGTNILGYGHPEVDEAVQKTITCGNMSTFNCPEEVYLAEKLIELHPWADMARFARSGGEANAIAIRIGRAASGKDKVAICGYHGWHDWYLSANLGNEKNLAGHLLPGLEPKGVPQKLRGTVFPFNYNNISELVTLVNEHEIGVIKMEVSRNEKPEDNYLKKVRKLATERGIVLIFDECTSGFRETNGGLHKKFGVNPDMAIFGKALGNGYAISAIIGKRDLMEVAQSTFISSTFWTERIGPTAALKTLEVMGYLKSWDTVTKIGQDIRHGWQKIADKYDLKVNFWGLPALTGFSFESPDALLYKTLITQEMLKKNYLASNCVYACIDHSKEILKNYFEVLDPIFGVIKDCEEGKDVNQFLEGPVCHAGFKRLN